MRKCEAQGGAKNCTNPRCPEKLAQRAAFFHDLAPVIAKKAKKEIRPALPSFASEEAIMDWVTEKYGGEVEYEISRNSGFAGHEYISVNAIRVPPPMRGQGIALHIRGVLQQFADQQNLLITGDPYDGGDETMERNTRSRSFKAHCLEHRERLKRAYFTTGYAQNPFFDYRSSHGVWKKSGGPKDADPLTGNFVVRDFEARDQFSNQGRAFLSRLDEFVYFPSGKVPAWMLAEGGKFEARGWRRPADVATRAEQEASHRAQYQAQLAREAQISA